MNNDVETQSRRVPSLVQYCQRVAAVHVDSISSLGDELRYDLVKPILERCTVEQLTRLEEASPHLQEDAQEIWKDLCFRKYPTIIERYDSGEFSEPASWRDQYYVLLEAEAKRLEDVGSRLRTQRLEAEERKKEREVKFTDQVPSPPKRPRTGWGMPPKTLFQKTRSEASKMQKNMYNAPKIHPMSNGKEYRPVIKPASVAFLPAPPADFKSRVTVNTVIHKRPSTNFASSSSSKPSTSSFSSAASSSISASSREPSTSTSASSSSERSDRATEPTQKRQTPAKTPFSQSPPASSETRPFKVPTPGKKDPMAFLFVPKHRAYSQRIK